MDFGDMREKIEKLIEEAQKWVGEKSLLESSSRMEEAQNLLSKLKQIAENDVQERAVERLTNELEYLGIKIDEILSKREAGKKGDGNIAFKCTWNDKHYKALCSDAAYDFNVNQGRAWCSSPECNCREYAGKELTTEDYPCYESIALKEMLFGAGWDHTGEKSQPRHIYNARIGKMAILTTRPPDAEEKDRLIVACLYVMEVHDDPGKETVIYADKDKSFEIDYDEIKIKFWDYYKNPGAQDMILWASGLFRYITDETVLNILFGIGEKYKNSGRDTGKIMDIIKSYEEIIKKKRGSNKI
ncbi:MAG: hypothetical protein KAJ14_03395 [Candidatus Omnitrophica bacterium]|nr:hypothetical protein [Candidatus Omnitrophota bacterium]